MILSIYISIWILIIGIVGGMCYYRNKKFNDYMNLTSLIIKDAEKRNHVITCNYLYSKYCEIKPSRKALEILGFGQWEKDWGLVRKMTNGKDSCYLCYSECQMIVDGNKFEAWTELNPKLIPICFEVKNLGALAQMFYEVTGEYLFNDYNYDTKRRREAINS